MNLRVDDAFDSVCNVDVKKIMNRLRGGKDHGSIFQKNVQIVLYKQKSYA